MDIRKKEVRKKKLFLQKNELFFPSPKAIPLAEIPSARQRTKFASDFTGAKNENSDKPEKILKREKKANKRNKFPQREISI